LGRPSKSAAKKHYKYIKAFNVIGCLYPEKTVKNQALRAKKVLTSARGGTMFPGCPKTLRRSRKMGKKKIIRSEEELIEQITEIIDMSVEIDEQKEKATNMIATFSRDNGLGGKEILAELDRTDSRTAFCLGMGSGLSAFRRAIREALDYSKKKNGVEKEPI